MTTLPEGNWEDLITIKQACKMLNVGTTWLYTACQRGEVPHIRLGANIRFELAELRAYVRAQRVTPPPIGLPTGDKR